MSFEVVPLIPPVMYLVAVPCMEQSSHVSLTESYDLCVCAVLNGRMYHMSNAYVWAGITTIL